MALRGMLAYFAEDSSCANVTPPCAWISPMPSVPSEPEPASTTPIARYPFSFVIDGHVHATAQFAWPKPQGVSANRNLGVRGYHVDVVWLRFHAIGGFRHAHH